MAATAGHLLDERARGRARGSSAPILALAALVTEGMPNITGEAVPAILILAVVNTAFAFTLWTHTQRRLAAFQSSVINTTMTVQVALLAAVVLGEPLGPRAWVALGLVFTGVLLAQAGGAAGRVWRWRRPR